MPPQGLHGGCGFRIAGRTDPTHNQRGHRAVRLYPAPPDCASTCFNPCDEMRVVKSAVLICLAFVATSGVTHAGQPASPQDSQNEESAESEQRLDGHVNPEESRRLRGELENFSQSYPDASQVTQRRRLIHDRMEERLSQDLKMGGPGTISRNEANLRWPRASRYFELIDANDDGDLTIDEIRAARDLLHDAESKSARAEDPADEPRNKRGKQRRKPRTN